MNKKPELIAYVAKEGKSFFTRIGAASAAFSFIL